MPEALIRVQEPPNYVKDRIVQLSRESGSKYAILSNGINHSFLLNPLKSNSPSSIFFNIIYV